MTGRGKIDNGKATMAETNPMIRVDPKTGIIRAAMDDRISHAFKRNFSSSLAE